MNLFETLVVVVITVCIAGIYTLEIREAEIKTHSTQSRQN